MWTYVATRLSPARQWERDESGLREELAAVTATLAAEAALLDATERLTQIAVETGIDPDHPGLQPSRHMMRSRMVCGPDVSREPVAGVVGDRQRP